MPELVIGLDIDTRLKKMIRRRYSVWQALGDIGGFFDGIKLVISIFMIPISGAVYFEEALKNKLYTP